MKTRRNGRARWANPRRQFELLERRNLLACDVVEAGDSNRDCYFDEADFVLAMTSGKFETAEAANWSEGDWSGDGLFNSADFVAAFQTANYRRGVYGETTDGPVTTLAPFADAGDADVTVYYLPDTGDLVAVAEGYLTALHFRSQSELFEAERQGPPPFDVNTSSDLFLVVPEGYQVIQFLSALPAGLSSAEVGADVLVTGATYGGGDLGNVQLGDATALPAGLPYEGVPPGGTGISNEFGEPPVVDPPVIEPPAIGNAAGDANRDGHVDQADLIQAMKSGAFETETPVEWAGGDWSGDQRFSSFDLVQMFKNGYYGTGAYHPDAGQAVNQLRIVAAPTASADVTLHYDPSTGDLIVAAHSGLITSLHIVSPDLNFVPIEDTISPTPFDRYSEAGLFLLRTEGVAALRIQGAMRIQLTPLEALASLKVDGSMKAGGGFGVVAIGNADQSPIDNVTDINEVFSQSFVDLADATALLTYDSATGDVSISALSGLIAVVELVSNANLFVGAGERDYAVGPFDISQPDRYFRLEPKGIDVIDLPGFLAPGLTIEQIRQSRIVVSGATLHSDPFQTTRQTLRLAVADPTLPPIGVGCGATRVIGDVDGDGEFGTLDLVTVFAAGHYEDDSIGNSAWAEGDWNCDGEFDSGDLVLAMQSGFSVDPTAAVDALTADRVLLELAEQTDKANG